MLKSGTIWCWQRYFLSRALILELLIVLQTMSLPTLGFITSPLGSRCRLKGTSSVALGSCSVASLRRRILCNGDFSHRSCIRRLSCCEKSNQENHFEKELCRNLEMSFRYVWLRLFTTGADDNYVMALRDFVRNSVAAYDAGYSLPALILELGRNEIETGDPNVDKTVRLTDQERQTREVWLVLVYLTLDRLNYNSKSQFKPMKLVDTLGLSALVDSTCEALKAGFSLEGLKLELSLRESAQPLTPAQLSLRSQWTRIVFLTSDVIKFQSA